MSLGAKNLADLSSSEKRALLIKLLEKKSKEPKSFPLSFAQEAIWFFEQLQPGSCVYNMPAALRVTGRIDTGVAERVANEIVKRHEVVRAAFSATDGKPLQTIAPAVSLPLASVDLREFRGSEQEQEVDRLVFKEIQRPFDLGRGPLLRVTLFRLGEEKHLFLATMHHIICDGWSLRVFIREMLALYEAFSSGRPSPLPELPIQYTDFVLWQRQWMQSEIIERQLEYWKQQLVHLPVLELPTDRARPEVQSFLGGTETFIVPETLNRELESVSREEGVTLFMTLLAAFQTLLYRYTGQEDMVVGTATAGRKRAEVEGLIGVLANALVLRTDMSGNPAFRELLQRVRVVCQGAYAHDDVPFEKLVEALQPKRDLRWTPLFRVMFRLIPSLPLLENQLISVTPLEAENGTTGFDLSLSMMDTGDGLRGSLTYSTDLFEAATVRRMAEHFRALLEAIVANPEQRLLSLPCLDEAERRQLLAKHDLPRRKGPLDRLEEIEDCSNLTQDQLLIWAGQKLQPDVPLYNLAAIFTIQEEIDQYHFRRAFQTLVNCSEAMRTVIEEMDGVPQQRVIADFPHTVEYLDFSLSSDPETEVQAWGQKRCQVLFDLEKRLFDCVLIKISDKKFAWYLNQHHMITDAWSVWLIGNRMAEFYGRSLKGQLEETVELPHFQDYINYKRGYRGSSRYLKDEAYWKEKLAKELEPLKLYGKTSVMRTTRVQRLSCCLGFERTEKLKALVAQERTFSGTLDASLFSVFAALLCTYLYRISGNRSIVFGTPFHNRRSKAFKETIGLFVKVLPLRIEIEEGDTFLSLIDKLKIEMFETLRHGQAGIKTPLQSKLYDVVLNYHHMSRPDFNGAPVDTQAVHTGHENHSLGLRIVDFSQSGNLTLEFDFHRDVFDEAARGQAMQHFFCVLDAFLEDPAQSLNQVSLLTAEERERILVEFNQTETPLPEKQTITELFELQVAKTPDAIALVFGEKRLTYRELNKRANQLAHYLRKRGVGSEVLVGVCMERSIEMIVGVLAIIKAGGAYVPLDPSSPRERLALVLEDAQARILLTQSHLSEVLPRSAATVIYFDSHEDEIAGEKEENPFCATMPDNLLYVIYTSGSTGIPKGVQISHRGLVNYADHLLSDFSLGFGDRVLQFAPLAFDTAAEEIFPCLLSGAALVLRTDTMLDSQEIFLQRCREWQVTVLDLPTAYWHELTVELLARDLALPEQVRLVYVGGEAMLPERVREWRQHVGEKVRLVNGYGPTETTVVATMANLSGPANCSVPSNDVAIGRPIANVQTYLLDRHLNPVPMGVPGEIHIGGAGVARGYLNCPELTAEKFIPHPFNTKPGAKLYKTGDLARCLPDGNIEFLGRIDDQVKIRGFRIELGEIEAGLGEHPAVRAAAVLAREDISGDPSDSVTRGPSASLRTGPSASLRTGKRLVAYVVLKQGQTENSNALRSFLKEKLPEYMVPSAFVLLDELPLTPNGKVDRRALMATDPAKPGSGKVFVAPRTPTEEMLTEIWAKILGVERVGVYDNFFDLGGHSLLAIQVVSRVHSAFGVELPLRRLFELLTVAEMAQAIEMDRQAGPGPGANDQLQINEKSPQASLFSEMTVADLNAEAVLDPAICREALPVEDVTEPVSILLTGATGFLGAFLLHELLETTRADIHCLVRAPNAAEGKKRIQENLELYSLWDERRSHRILGVPGDLSQPHLGLSLEEFQILAGQVEVIYHNGALVNFMYPYYAHKPSNVLGTEEVLRLASEIKLKPVHYVSTVSVFQGISRMGDQPFGEQEDLDQTGAPYGGYAQSKWVAEKLVMIAGSRGLPIAIYRPGLLSGHSQSGIWNADAFVVNILRACMEFGTVPDLDVWVDLAPVDYVSKAIVHLSKQKKSFGKVFHLANPLPARNRQLLDWLDSLGYRLQQISFEDWRNLLLNLAEYVQQDAWGPFLHVLRTVEKDQITGPRVQCQNTLAGLVGSSITCPPVGPELLRTYLSYFIRRGFVKASLSPGEAESYSL